jgi:hypothetical protein
MCGGPLALVLVMSYVHTVVLAEPPNAADWLEAYASVLAAVGTLLAFGWQAFALSRERQTRASEIARLDRERLDDQKSQARTVTLHSPTFSEHEEFNDLDVYTIQVGNYGPSPITNVIGRLRFYPDSGDPISLVGDYKSKEQASVVAPGASAPLTWTVQAERVADTYGLEEEEQVEYFDVEIEFNDVQGTRWRWSQDADPQRVVPPRGQDVEPPVRGDATAPRGS